MVNKTVEAKIDRLEGVVSFCKAKNPSDLLDDWTYNISSLMNFVNKTTHLITKEEMIHKLLWHWHILFGSDDNALYAHITVRQMSIF